VNYLPINEDDKSIGVSGCSCTACGKTKNIEGKARFAGYDQIPLKTSESSKVLSDHEYLICSQKIFVSQSYVPNSFENNKWKLMHRVSRALHSSKDHGVSNQLYLTGSTNRTIW
jgi:hypothetical protein